MTNEVDLTIDNTPPGRVTDLTVTNAFNTVNLIFTSPGDNLDSNEPVASYILKYSTTAGNLTGANFDKEVFNVEITANDLVDSDLAPVDGGAVKQINIKSVTFSPATKYVIALKAVDDGSNQSPVSNMVQIYLSALDGTTTTTTTTTRTSTTTGVLDHTTTTTIISTTTTKATTTSDLLPISTELTIGLSVGVFLGSFAATLLRKCHSHNSQLDLLFLQSWEPFIGTGRDIVELIWTTLILQLVWKIYWIQMFYHKYTDIKKLIGIRYVVVILATS